MKLTTSFYTARLIGLLAVVIGLSIFHHALAAESSGIKIDNQNRQLVAPRGENYQWYLNGRLLPSDSQQRIEAGTSGEYMVEVTDEKGNISVELIRVTVVKGVIHRIFIIGDSTVATYKDSSYPQKGWGQIFQLFFDNSQIEVVNKSIGGRSSRSFYEEGRWTEVINSLDSGDYVFIQFGHNDRDWTKPERYTDTAAYKDYLRIYVNETRAENAFPVLVSPMIMHAYRGTTLRNVFTENENDYRGSMLQVAQELNVPFIDLNMKSYDRILEVGKEYAGSFLYLGLLPGEYPNFPDGSSDGTHFQEMGALEMGKLVVEGIKELESESNMSILIASLVPTYDLNVEMNIPDAGLHTLSGSYPAGTQVTLKTSLKNGYQFHQWEDDSMNIFSENNLTIFTMQPKNYSVKAMVKDCNEDIGGSAMLDNCSICSGGNTGILPCANALQSETACGYEGTIESLLINGINRTYINTASVDSPYVQHSINASSAGIYQFALVYSSPENSQTLDIYLNDIREINNMEIGKTENWKTAGFELNLVQGTNDVKIIPGNADTGMFIDQLAYYSDNLNKGTCKVSEFKENNVPEIMIFPNPSHENFKIVGIDNLQYQIFNTLGVLVEKGTCWQDCLIGQNLDNGLYLFYALNDSVRYRQIIRKY